MAEHEAVPQASGPTGRYATADGGTARDSPVRARLEDQIAWYDARSEQNQHRFKQLKVCQIVIAAGIPVAAAASAPVWIMGGGGALIVIMEGLQQLQQYQQNWTTYRSTCERLKHEKFLFLSAAGPYQSVRHPEVLLATRVEGLVSQEHAAWVSHREEASEHLEDNA
jgi:protein-S-isoprenylcysteine O-methyltransferase Ste14